MAQTILNALRNNKFPYDATPFAALKAEEFSAAVDDTIASARAEIETIRNSPLPPTFANTVEAMEYVGKDLNRVTEIFFNLLHAATQPIIDEQAAEISQKLAAFGNDIQLDEKLFARVKVVFDSQHKLSLTRPQARLLEHAYLEFVRNGALLTESQKNELRAIDSELAQLGPAFGQNLLKATNSYTLNIADAEKVKNLPSSVQEAAREEASKRGQTGYTFTLQAPSVIPFLKYMPDRELREQFWRANSAKAFTGEFSNVELCQKIATLRNQRARLLGYGSHAHFVLERRMAKTPTQVLAFLEKLKGPSILAAQREVKDLQTFVTNELGEKLILQPWDFSYYSEQYKKHLFAFAEEDLRPYFPLAAVREGIFAHGEKLYGLSFHKAELPVYHEDVEVFEVRRDNQYVGLLYLDFFPRDNKRAGAWMTTFKGQGFDGDKMNRPHVSLVCNFSKPTADSPSLLTFNEVQTLFHEFGHGLHSLLSDCYYPSQAGTNVMWDFVELPSQIMENWTYEKESLDLFARHYQTGAKIPQDLVDKLRTAMKFQAGVASARQLSFAYLDLNWHTDLDTKNLDVVMMEDKAIADFRVLPKVEGANFTVSFSHVFAGGYAAGYYSYKWAEVLDADAFEYFKEKGVFNREIATRFYAHILSKGATEDPAILYRNFRGRDPDPKALLSRSGLA